MIADNYRLWFVLVQGDDKYNAGIEKYARQYPELVLATEEHTGKTALHCAFEARAETNVLSLLGLGASMVAIMTVEPTVVCFFVLFKNSR